MSYILDALRRAESERGRRRGVPGLHAQQLLDPAADEGDVKRSPWAAVAAGLAVGVVLMFAWRWWSAPPLDDATMARSTAGGSVTAGAAGAVPAAVTTPAATAEPGTGAAPTPAPGAASEPMPTRAAATAANTTNNASAAPAARTEPTQAMPAPPPAAGRTRHRAVPHGAAASATTAAQGGTAAASSAAPPRAAAPQPRLPTLAELPDDLRSSVPQLAFGGSVYSDAPTQRMVIFNGQVLHEGDALTSDLQIEQIRPRSAVLRVRGQRFEMPF